jgi:large subunit ribosomal protein L13
MSTAATARNRGKHDTYMAKTGEVDRKWLLVDATDKPLGRLAARIATVLQGKHRATYTPHVDTGDFVVVTNCSQLKITGNKRRDKVYTKYTGYPGGLKEITLGELMEKNPAAALESAVRRMLPKGRLGRRMFKKLNAYAGSDHPHAAQKPVSTELLSAGNKGRK